MATLPKDTLRNLHGVCSKTLELSLQNEFLNKINKSYSFATDLSVWSQVLSDLPECFLFKKAEQEYLIAILNLAQGQYRNSFKCLRLVLELYLQGIYLSVNLIELNEWLRNSADTNWNTLVSTDKGPLSTRFCKSFFPEIVEHSNYFQTITSTLYRELSETIHGNVPLHIPIPESFDFCEPVFNMWYEKATTAKLIVHFALSVRYLSKLDDASKSKLENSLIEELGHINQIRAVFGGTVSS